MIKEKTYKQLFDSYYDPLVGFAISYLKNSSEAEDVVQDVFLKLWDRRSETHNTTNLKSLLFTATKNRCISSLRNVKCSRKYLENLNYINIIALENSQLSELECEDLSRQIESVIETLPEDYRKIFFMSRIDNMSHLEIAQQLNISIKTVEKKIGGTLKLFRKKLSDYHYTIFFTIYF